MDSMTFHRSYFEAICEMPKETQLELFHAVCQYGLDGVEPEVSGITRAMFMLMKPNIDSSNNKRSKNSENGAKGGRPKSETNPTETQTEPKHKQTEPKHKQTEPTQKAEREGEREREEEREAETETERETPPSPPSGRKRPKTKTDAEYSYRKNLAYLNTLELDEDAFDLLSGWCRYKLERGEAYVETGFRTFVGKVRKQIATNGIEAVAEVIELTMSNGWQGVVWDKIRAGPPVPPEPIIHESPPEWKYDPDKDFLDQLGVSF